MTTPIRGRAAVVVLACLVTLTAGCQDILDASGLEGEDREALEQLGNELQEAIENELGADDDFALRDFDTDQEPAAELQRDNVLLQDLDGDGEWDLEFRDRDRDGTWDLEYRDTDGDGDFDVAFSDVDGDGQYDNYYEDSNRDGEYSASECIGSACQNLVVQGLD